MQNFGGQFRAPPIGGAAKGYPILIWDYEGARV